MLEKGKLTIIGIYLISIASLFFSACSAQHNLELHLEAEGEGTVSGGGSYVAGTEVVIEAEPGPGHIFTGWLKDNEELSSERHYSFNLTENAQITALFEPDMDELIESETDEIIEIQLSSNIDEQNLSGEGNYQENDIAEVSAPDSPLYSFVHWTENGQVVSTDKNYRFTVEDSRTLKAVREVNIRIEELVDTDNLSGYLLPLVRQPDYSEKVTGAINLDGQTIIKSSDYLHLANWRHDPFLNQRTPKLIDSTNPLIIELADPFSKTIVINQGGETITTLPADKEFAYNEFGYTNYQDGYYGFISHTGNQVLEYEYDHIIANSALNSALLIKKDGKWGLVESRSGNTIIPVRYDQIHYRQWLNAEIYKAVIGDDSYLYSERGELITRQKYDQIETPVGGLMAVKNKGKWGVIDRQGNEIIRTLYDQIGQIRGRYITVEQDGRWGLISSSGRMIITPAYEQLSLDLGFTPPSNALAFFKDGNNVGFIDSSGKVIFKGEKGFFAFEEPPHYPIRPIETNGDHLFFYEEGHVGIMSISGETLWEPIFEGYAFAHLPATCDPDAFRVSSTYTLLRKDGHWAFFHDGRFVTDFKFKRIGGPYFLPMVYSGLPQVMVEQENSQGAGLYDLKNGKYIIEPGQYEDFTFLIGGKAKVRKDGRYGFVDVNGQVVIEPEYDQASLFNNGVVLVQKDDQLNAMDSDGNYILEPVRVEGTPWLRLEYLSGPGVFSSIGNSYFDQDGWIKKP